MCISKKKQCYNTKSSAYNFCVKTKILADFHNCISKPLKKVYLAFNEKQEKPLALSFKSCWEIIQVI